MLKRTKIRLCAIVVCAALAVCGVPAAAIAQETATAEVSGVSQPAGAPSQELSQMSADGARATANTVLVTAEAYCDRAEALNLLSYANDFREMFAIHALNWNSTLAAAAEQRAIELAFVFDHKRPDGTPNFSIVPSEAYISYVGENIAKGTSSAYETNEAWLSNPGDYANLQNHSFKSMGAACLVAADGTKYWVMFLSGAMGDAYPAAVENSTDSFNVYTPPDTLRTTADHEVVMSIGETHKLSARINGLNVSPTSFAYTSSDPTHVVVDYTGVITAVLSGEATVTATYAGSLVQAFATKVKVEGVAERPIARSFIYNGQMHVGVSDGLGYYLSGTSRAVAVGTYSVTVTLKNGYTWQDGRTDSFILVWTIADPINFYDVPKSAWYARDDILGYIVINGIMRGYDGTGCFGPEDPISRGQIAKVLHNMAGKPSASMQHFTDVNYDLYYGVPIDWARTTGIVYGYMNEDGTSQRFGPDDPVTREQLATMLYRYASIVKSKNVYTDCSLLNAMPDAGDVSSYARQAVGWALDKGIIEGAEWDGRKYVNPLGATKRCEAAAMFARFHRDIL